MDLLAFAHRACDECDGLFRPSRSTSRFCSTRCRHEWHRKAKRCERDDRSCVVCGKVVAMRAGQESCSRRCHQLKQRAGRRIDGPQVFSCGHCGEDFTRPAARGQRPKWCPSCRSKKRQINVPKRVRLAVYERDDWVCQLCFEPVDRDAPPRSDWAPSIDHIVPRSVVVDDAPENLRLAHHWCNSIRADDSAYTIEDLVA